ncbi:MAG: ChaN family lipoprotein [Flavobacteriales bacterium]|jgi:uncharacterized iron-regulated protein|nr:ChaN family lipoprotein [Flavobacteriales bacterium]
MKKILTITLLIAVSFSLQAQKHLETFKIYNKKGKEIHWKKLNKKVKEAEMVFLGELHNNPIAHWVFLELIKKQFSMDSNIQVGAEMFERDNQILIDEYFSGFISKKKFENEARLWPNYKTDYKPTFDFCFENNLSFSATNIPRRYASAVYKNGAEHLEKLSDEAKNWICPLPFPFDGDLAVYQELQKFSGHGGINLAKAQAVKDATMAHFILKDKKSENRYFHLNGNKHSEVFQGIIWYLKKYGFTGEILTIHTETNKNLEWEEAYQGLADFIIVVDEDIL